MSRWLRSAGLLLGLWLAAPVRAWAQEDPVVLVANGPIAAEELKASQVKGLFLGTRSSLPGSPSLVPVTQGSQATASAAFFESVMRLPMADFERLWQERQLSGQGMTPLKVETTAEALALVASTPGAVTYALASEPLPPGLVAVAIKVRDGR